MRRPPAAVFGAAGPADEKRKLCLLEREEKEMPLNTQLGRSSLCTSCVLCGSGCLVVMKEWSDDFAAVSSPCPRWCLGPKTEGEALARAAQTTTGFPASKRPSSLWLRSGVSAKTPLSLCGLVLNEGKLQWGSASSSNLKPGMIKKMRVRVDRY